jgi:phospholipid transport system substrate-binding protein
MRRPAGLFFALLLAAAFVPNHARAATGPEDTVRGFYATLLDTMRHAPELGEKGRYDTLAPVIRRSFDLPAMARLAVGPGWASFTPEQRQRVTEAFSRYTIATYADRFSGYSGEKLEVTGQQAGPYGTLVDSRIVKSDGSPVRINYLLRRNGDNWQIADVYLTGTISQLASLRSQFSAVLAREGIDGLVATLNRKTEMLVANASAS